MDDNNNNNKDIAITNSTKLKYNTDKDKQSEQYKYNIIIDPNTFEMDIETLTATITVVAAKYERIKEYTLTYEYDKLLHRVKVRTNSRELDLILSKAPNEILYEVYGYATQVYSFALDIISFDNVQTFN